MAPRNVQYKNEDDEPVGGLHAFTIALEALKHSRLVAVKDQQRLGNLESVEETLTKKLQGSMAEGCLEHTREFEPGRVLLRKQKQQN